MPDKNGHASDEELLSNALPMPKEDAEQGELIEDGGTIDHALDPIEVGDLSAGAIDPSEMTSTKIKAFGVRTPHEDHWQRMPNVNGTGAIHVKTFVTKLRMDALAHLDTQVNEWLDNHPEYEVKFVTTTVGTLFGKNKEEALFMNVWV